MGFDLKNLEEIASGDTAFVTGALQLFLSKKEEYTEMVNAAIAKEDSEEIRKAIHKIKSSVSVLGYAETRELWAKFEKEIESGLVQAPDAIAKAETVFAKYIDILKEVDAYLQK